jgi:hypothetical protein
VAVLVQFELGDEWSRESVDLCWLDCPDAGFRLRTDLVGGFELVLCVKHARELEIARGGAPYELADPPSPPSEAFWWPWQEFSEERWADVAA